MAPKRTPVHATPLVERIQRDYEARQLAQAKRAGGRAPAKPEVSTPKRERLPKYVPLTVWAELMFGEHAPHRNTLMRWVNDGRIYPLPKKIGRTWFCTPDADYIDD